MLEDYRSPVATFQDSTELPVESEGSSQGKNGMAHTSAELDALELAPPAIAPQTNCPHMTQARLDALGRVPAAFEASVRPVETSPR